MICGDAILAITKIRSNVANGAAWVTQRMVLVQLEHSSAIVKKG